MRDAARLALVVTGALLGAVSVTPAQADPILPAPTASTVDTQLGTLATGFQLQQDVFATSENGLSLDVTFNASDVATVKSFFAQSAVTDFQTFTGQSPFGVVETFGEWGDEGNFAGVASVGVAARLMALEASGAPADQVSAARASAVAAATAWHVWATIGGPGVVARGVRRTVPLVASSPPLPGTLPTLTPLTDGSGNPLPATKAPTWRAPVASGLSDWIWYDDTSKDQVVGYALAAAWLWDALQGDPNVDPSVTQNLANDMVALVQALQKVAPELGIDLLLRDADGRLTDSGDLNPLVIISGNPPVPATSTLRNGFNAALALAIVRAAYHVSGDAGVGAYYYDDLVGSRDLPSEMLSNCGVIFLGDQTNFSNVNMLAIALASLGRFETDPYVLGRLASTLQTQFWSTGDSRDVSHDLQAWFDVVYGAYAPGVTEDIRSRMQADLGAFQAAPAIERTITNCTPAALDAGVCTAIDGMTIIHPDPKAGFGGELVATAVVPQAIRPDSDFEWRSNPFAINGTASTLMDPRGDWLAAYWLGRLMDTDSTKNVSPNARPPLPYSLDGGAQDGGPPATSPGSHGGGCGCGAPGEIPWGGSAMALGAGLALVLVARSRRRRA